MKFRFLVEGWALSEAQLEAIFHSLQDVGEHYRAGAKFDVSAFQVPGGPAQKAAMIVSALDPDELMHKVNALLASGWSLVGRPFTVAAMMSSEMTVTEIGRAGGTSFQTTVVWYQSLTRYTGVL